ncbi:hypothetical protein AYI68_g855 [Smittium mucronatum]|uniref:RRM domain-containing protein n=1 Tax=Smittium mucronatum TaxID=133383 RepID=A0A1R0H779_9FUNG|nr:hypothetical protein AYI68_g855 [Smittium mucronatum]
MDETIEKTPENLEDVKKENEAAHLNSEGLSKREKKDVMKMILKKKAAYETFAKLEGLERAEKAFSKLPRKTLIIVNLGYGAVGGSSSEEIERIFSGFKGFEKVVMAHGKPYTFVEFRGGEESIIARDELHEKPCSTLNNKILFLEFVNHLDFAYFSDRASPNVNGTLNEAPGLYYFGNFLNEMEQSTLLDLVSAKDENMLDQILKIRDLQVEDSLDEFPIQPKNDENTYLGEESWLTIQNRKIVCKHQVL